MEEVKANKKKPIKITSWTKCYPSSWRGLIVPDAITHPAKFSSKLIRRIYDHILEEGWVREGSSVLDPFGGVALGAFDAMRLGLRWRGVELESKFSDIGNANIAFWNSRFSSMPHWSMDARLINGDSRKMMELLKGESDASVSSPPFADSLSRDGLNKSDRRALARSRGISNAKFISPIDMEKIGGRNQEYGSAEGNLGNMPATKEGFDLSLSSPPYADSIKTGNGSGFDFSKSKTRTGHKKTEGRENIAKGYGVTDGNLASLQVGDFDATISSPPFLQSKGGTNVSEGMDPAVAKRHAAGNGAAKAYGESDGQLTNMAEGDFDQAVSSPPYLPQDDRKVPWGHTIGTNLQEEDERRGYKADNSWRGNYSMDPANLGNPTGADQTDFWTAARTIVEQTYAALKNGGESVADGEDIDFCDCE